MILGIGTDLIDIRRIEQLLKAHGQKFLDKTFTQEEIRSSQKYSDDKLKAMFFAKRFAAKEAFSKAVGCGFGDNVRFLDLSIENNDEGKPSLIVKNKTLQYVLKCFTGKQLKIDLSLSDDYPMALAFVIISEFWGKNEIVKKVF